MAFKNEDLTPEERETSIYQSAADRDEGFWHIYSDDHFWMKRLDKIAESSKPTGVGKDYRLRQDQVVLRKAPRELTEEEKLQRQDRFRKSDTPTHRNVHAAPAGS
jgi:hypothetical protein